MSNINILPVGSVNPAAIQAPGVYVVETLPQAPISGVATNRIGTIGTASWGEVDVPVTSGSLTEAISNFGNPSASDPFDLMTHVLCQTSMGANNLVCVRVTDGTDIKASIAIVDVTSPTPVTGMTVTAVYSGTVGNTLNVIVSAGTNSTVGTPLFKVTVFFPIGFGNGVPEVYDNIGGTGAILWQNIVNAINMGQGSQRPPSSLITATIGTATLAPALATYVLTGGTNGNSGVTANDLVGLDVTPRTGMYALRGTAIDLLVLANVTDNTTYAAQVEFSVYEACYAMLARPFGESYTSGIAAKKAVGLDSPWGKLLVGDWVQIQDNFNKVQRYVSPQSFTAGVLANLIANQSGLNKQIISGVFVGTQSSNTGFIYSKADVGEILTNGLDVIALPSPGGYYFSLQTGKNTSSNALANGDQFTRLTDYIAGSLGSALGVFIGQLQTPTEINEVKSACSAFLRSLQNQQIIGSSTGGQAYTVSVDSSQAALGIQIVNVSVAFFGVVVVMLVNLQTGLSSIASVTPQ